MQAIEAGPRIYVVGRTQMDMAAVNSWLGDHHTRWENDLPFDGTRDLELIAEFGGRHCYDAFGDAQFRKENGGYLDNIMGSAHGSVIEHAVVNLLVEGVSRSLTHELIRHRVGVGYSQRSQRYVDETETDYVVPPAIRDNGEAYRIWQDAIEYAEAAYAKLHTVLSADMANDTALSKRSRRIAAREAARSVLPQATGTRILVTANLRTLRHICELRGGVGAEAEIRRFAVALARLMKKEAPNVFSDMDVRELEDGKMGVVFAYHKV